MSQGYLSHIELGTKKPTDIKLRRIAAALGVPLDAVSYVIPDCGHIEPEDEVG